MLQGNNTTTQPFHPAALGKRMLLGAGIALILIIIFLVQAGDPDPAWPKLWMARPLIIVPVAGAMGGAFSYFAIHLLSPRGWKKTLLILLSLVVYIIGLWLGTILGLDGTMWD